MSPESILDAVLKITEPAEQSAFLDAACGEDMKLRQEIELLILAHAASGDFMNRSALPQGATQAENATRNYVPRELSPGTVIAKRYILEQKLGEGGMGEVWVARQSEPVKRRVALKLIKPGMDSRSVVQRFEQERQALAMMDHPHIARVYDGGVTSDHRPFFVMELVNGLPLTKFCDSSKLTPRQRLELFVPICQGVQHAHNKGIVHRDLKPGNIIVCVIDGKPVPKIIDFGVAKATGGKLTDESMATQLGAVIGTLEYMAPEQAGFSSHDIDTRADLYSLGVILYELLTGLRPFDAKRLRQAALDEVIRIIREEDPPSLASRLSTDESLPSVAAVRGTEPRRLLALIKGELDWIVHKCLEKDRERRYETANGLARDIQRYLTDEVVEARPPSASYRLKKLLKRHKGKVIAACLVLATLIIGIIGTSIGLFEARRQEELANDARKAEALRAEGERLAKLDAQAKEKLAGERLVLAETEKKKADAEKQIAQAVRDFLLNRLLGQADSSNQADALLLQNDFTQDARKDLTVRELLDRAAKSLGPDQINSNFPGQFLVHAEILHSMGRTYLGVGEAQKAFDFLERSVALRKEHLGKDHPLTLSSLSSLAKASLECGKLSQALEQFKLVYQEQQKILGHEHKDTLLTLVNLAGTYRELGNFFLAVQKLEEAQKLLSSTLGDTHPYTLSTMNNLAGSYRDAGRYKDAIRIYEQVRDLQIKTRGANHPDTLSTLNNLGLAHQLDNRINQAIELFQKSLEVKSKVLGDDHPDTLTTKSNLASAFRDSGKYVQAIELLEQICQVKVQKLGPDHPSSLNTSSNLANALRLAGRFPQAIALFEQVIEKQKTILGIDHPARLTAMNNLALAYQSTQKFETAIALLEQVHKAQVSKLGEDHPNTLGTLYNLGLCYRDHGMMQQSINAFNQIYERRLKISGMNHVSTLDAMQSLAKSYARAGQADKALSLYRPFIEAERQRTSGNLAFSFVIVPVAAELLNCGKPAEAEELFREALTLQEKSQPNRWTTYYSASMLGDSLFAQKKFQEAEPWLLKGAQGLLSQIRTIPPQRTDRLSAAIDRILQFYTETNKPDEVKKWQAEKAKLTKPESSTKPSK